MERSEEDAASGSAKPKRAGFYATPQPDGIGFSFLTGTETAPLLEWLTEFYRVFFH